MLTHNLLNEAPLFEGCLTNLIDAALAEVFNLGLVGVAHRAKVLEMDVDNKILRDHPILIFTDVFRTQFHFPSLDVISPLYKRRVKHYPEHLLVRKPRMLKDNLDIAMQGHRQLLLLCE